MQFHWYPGHMTKAKRQMQEDIKLIDLIIELVDARIPYSSKNPDIDELAKNKYRILLLNKCDLAEEKITALWETYYQQKGFAVIKINSLKGTSMTEVTNTARAFMKEKVERLKARGRLFVPIRSMIVGIPNVGKSTFINTLSTIDVPTKGQVFINGTEVRAMGENEVGRFRYKNLGFIFQEFNLLDSLTIFENIAIPLTLSDTPLNEIKEKKEEMEKEV